MPLPEIPRAAIEQRAHKIWIAKGRREGHAVADWVQAENELRAEAARSAKPAMPTSGGNFTSTPSPTAPARGAATPPAAPAKAGAVPAAGGTNAPASAAGSPKSGGKGPKGKRK